MTEAQWQAATDPGPMLQFLRGKVSDRKLRLFAVAGSRRFLPLVSDRRVGEALDVVERFADGLAGDGERSNARKLAQQAAQARGVAARPVAPKWERRAASLAYYAAAREATEAAWNVPGLAAEVLVWRSGGYAACDSQVMTTGERAVHAALLRDIFGNPFRAVAVNPAWRTLTVTSLAGAAYEERALLSGELNTARLAVLSDALEEAGCDDDLLAHVRSPGPHVRGCWALDLVLGKV